MSRREMISVCFWLILCGFSAVKCEIDENSYNVISTMINSPVRPLKGIHNKLGLDNSKLNTLNELETEEIDPIENDLAESHTVKKDEAVFEDFTPTQTPVSETEESVEENPRGTETEGSVVKDGFRKFRKIYDACNKKINKRINKLLKAKVNIKTNTEKDLFELKEYVISLYRCFKVSSFRYLDDVLGGDVIPVSDYVDFVRDESRDLKDSPVINIIPFLINGKLSLHNNSGKVNESISSYASNVLKNDWNSLILERFGRLLHTHSLKFRIDEAVVEGRGRRRDHRMFAMMVMGFMIMASILIPMGFQFLTVLGGKSLLMAKMALIMSAINGLKKIATSHVGYGFYHTAPDGYHHDHHHHGFHEKVFRVKPEEPQSPFKFL